MAPLSARATAHPSSKNSSSGFGLPTPQTVSHGSKTRSRADSASHLQSHSVAQSGLPLPQTPSRSKSKFDVDHTARTTRTTPHSQRIVPSSQYFDDEQASLASSLEGIADERDDPFLLPNSREPDEDLALPSLFKLPYPPSRAPTSVSSSSLPFASVSSNGCSSRHRSQNSQIVPTSQFDEVELGFSSETQAVPLPVRSPLVNHDKNAPSLKRYIHLVTLSNAVLMILMVQVGSWTSTKLEPPSQEQSYAGVVGRYPPLTTSPSFKPTHTSNSFLFRSTRNRVRQSGCIGVRWATTTARFR